MQDSAHEVLQWAAFVAFGLSLVTYNFSIYFVMENLVKGDPEMYARLGSPQYLEVAGGWPYFNGKKWCRMQKFLHSGEFRESADERVRIWAGRWLMSQSLMILWIPLWCVLSFCLD